MDKLFELSADLTLDAGAFLSALFKAEQAAQTAASTLISLQSAASAGWGTVCAAIQSATDRMKEFLTLQGGASAPGYATGIDYVPYNNFPARLHEGEAVLTALEASQWRAGHPNGGNADAHAIAQAVAAALSGAAVQMDGHAVGQLVAPTVSQEIARETSSLTYRK